jgi:transposase
LQVKAIAQAHVKTDKIDAGTLASLHAAGYLPQIWTPDAETERKRRLVARRYQVVRHRTRLKNEVHSILHAHLIPKCPHADLFNARGRAWLAAQSLPDDERAAIDRHVRELDRLAEDLALLDREIAQDAIDDPAVNRLMTITGVNLAVAAGIVAAIGDISRFNSPQKLVSYFGLNPRVRQSGLGAAHHGRISKIGRSHARAMLVEAAWTAAKAPGPLHAFFVRIRARRGHQIAAVAMARKLTVLLAFVDEGRGLSMGAPGAGRQQDPRDATSSWTSATEGQPAWTSLCLQHQGATRPRDVDCRPGGAKLRTIRVAMETTAAKKPARGCLSSAGQNRQSGDACSRRVTLRHEVARARRP